VFRDDWKILREILMSTERIRDRHGPEYLANLRILDCYFV